jgi:hypothetical protein
MSTDTGDLVPTLNEAYNLAEHLRNVLALAYEVQPLGMTRRDLADMFADADDLASRISNLALSLRS